MSEKELIANPDFVHTTNEMESLMRDFIEKSTIAASSMRGSRQARKELRAITVTLGKLGKDYRKHSTSFDQEVTGANKESRPVKKEVKAAPVVEEKPAKKAKKSKKA